MSDFSWAPVVMGIVLICTALLDIFMTVLHTQIESPISNGLTRRLWRILTSVAERLPENTGGVLLAWGAPMMIVGIIVFWLTLLIVDFGLLYLPFVHDTSFFVIGAGHQASPLEDALYRSAVSFLTIGYGDIVAVHALPRALNVTEGGLGLLTISMAVTYLLSVYPLIPRKLALAVALNQETAGRADRVAIAARYVVPGRFETIGERLRMLNDEMLYLAHAHSFFPALLLREAAQRVRVLCPHARHHVGHGCDATLWSGLGAVPRRD